MASKTYVLTWTVDGVAGAFCPSGGLTEQEVEDAEWRLRQHAESAGVDIEQQMSIRRMPYVFDIREAPMPAGAEA